jgi:hypothetical protein
VKLQAHPGRRRKEKDLYGPPMPYNAKLDILRDWRRPDIYRKNYPDW